MAHPRGLELDHHFAALGAVEIDGHDFQWLAGGVSNCSTCFHGETWGLPAALLRQLDMEEVEAEEGMSLVLDAPVHVHTAPGAGVALDGGLLVHDLELLVVRGHADLVPSGYADQREQRAFGLPALGAAAHVVERHVRRDAHRHRIARAPAGECSACEARRALLYTLINQGVNLDCHGSLSLASGFERDICSSCQELIRTPPCPP